MHSENKPNPTVLLDRPLTGSEEDGCRVRDGQPLFNVNSVPPPSVLLRVNLRGDL